MLKSNWERTRPVCVIVGNPRDNVHSYLEAARAYGWKCVLIEQPKFARSASAALYDDVIEIDRPTDAHQIKSAIREIDGDVIAILSSVEAYVAPVWEAAANFDLYPYTAQTDFVPLSKYEFSRKMQESGLGDYFPDDELIDWEDALSQLQARTNGYSIPVVMKPEGGGGALGVMLVRTPEEITRAIAVSKELIPVSGNSLGRFFTQAYEPYDEISLQVVVDRGCARVLSTAQS